jgi:hypothetical protein
MEPVSAELDARRVAAAAVLADFDRWEHGVVISVDGAGDWPAWAERLAAHMRHVLDQIQADAAAEPVHECQPGARLAEIRAVLEVFDWATDDRQYALEQIEDIVLRSNQ